jgi:hypothetical protein
MKKHSLRKVISAVLTIFIYRLKLIGKDKATRIILLASVFIFAWMIFSLSVSAREQSSLPVGIVDHEMAVQVKLGGPAHGLDYGRSKCQVGDEVAVHHIEMEHLGAAALDARDFVG